MPLILQNEYLRITVRPDCGGRIDQIHDRVSGKDWLWHPPSYDEDEPRPVAPGASFDAHWSGGFEEMFPNDAALELDGQPLPDHGELWSAAWTVEEHDASRLRMAFDCSSVPVLVEKTLTLEPGARGATVSYRLRNRSQRRVPFMLKLHPALVIEEGDEIDMPDCELEPVALGFSRIIGQPGLARWPRGRAADGSEVLLNRAAGPSSGLREFIYCSRLADGFCAISNTRSGSRFELRFERADFPYVWLFLSYGGFEGRQVAILEPCTSKPYDLAAAIGQGTAAWLEADEVRDIEVQLRIGG